MADFTTVLETARLQSGVTPDLFFVTFPAVADTETVAVAKFPDWDDGCRLSRLAIDADGDDFAVAIGAEDGTVETTLIAAGAQSGEVDAEIVFPIEVGPVIDPEPEGDPSEPRYLLVVGGTGGIGADAVVGFYLELEAGLNERTAAAKAVVAP